MKNLIGIIDNPTPEDLLFEIVQFLDNSSRYDGEFKKAEVSLYTRVRVSKDLNEVSLYDLEAKVKVLISVPSLDTGVCQAETRKFNEELGKRPEVMGLIISRDLPFASKRFCEAEGIENVVALSDYRYGDFGKEFSVEMVDGALKGLLARVVFVLNEKNEIVHTEMAEDILKEPDYEVILEKVDSLLA